MQKTLRVEPQLLHWAGRAGLKIRKEQKAGHKVWTILSAEGERLKHSRFKSQILSYLVGFCDGRSLPCKPSLFSRAAGTL